MTIFWAGLGFLSAFALFVLVCLLARDKARIQVSDYFVGFLALQFGPLVLSMPQGLLGEPFRPETVSRAWSILCVMYVFMAAGFFAFHVGTRPVLHNESMVRGEVTALKFGEKFLLTWVLLTMAAMAATLLSIPSVRNFLSDFGALLFGVWDNSLYSEIRRFRYADDTAITEVVSRARYSITAALFVTSLAISRWLRIHGATVTAISVGFFLVAAASLSKLPWITYLVYALLLGAHLRQNCGRRAFSSYQMGSIIFGGIIAFAALTALYIVQYEQWEASDFFGEPLDLARYRVFGIFYSGLLRYAEVYPDMIPFTEGASIGLFASIFDVVPRTPSLEVAQVWLGAWNTTNPVMFAGAAWADFGYVGVCIYSLAVGMYLAFLNRFAGSLRSTPIRSAFEVVAGVNAVMLVQIALPPIMLSHGLGIFPVIFWLMDRIVSGRSRYLAARRISVDSPTFGD